MKLAVMKLFFLVIMVATCSPAIAMHVPQGITHTYQAIEKIDGKPMVVDTTVIDSQKVLRKVLRSFDFFNQAIHSACSSSKSRQHLENQYKFYKESKNIFLLYKAADAVTVLIATTYSKSIRGRVGNIEYLFIKNNKVALYRQYLQWLRKINTKIDALE